MAKLKYRFNQDTLNFEMITTTTRDKIISGVIIFVASIVISVGYYAIYSHIYDTPKERAMINKLSAIKFNYQMLTQDMEHIDLMLADIQKRDDNIYRTILESEPIPVSVRQAGFGGINRYEPLEGYLNSNLMISAARHTDKIVMQLWVQSISYDELIFKAINKEQLANSRPAIMPISIKDLTSFSSRFGWRAHHPVHGGSAPHNGIDLSAPTGTSIYATGDGTVVKVANNSSGYGKLIVIHHGFGFETRYAHMHSFDVSEGNEVKRGQKIGTVGSTGTSNGPHVHYEVHKNGKPINPINYLYLDMSPDEYVRIIEQAQNDNDSLASK